jgi:hypothetical protein
MGLDLFLIINRLTDPSENLLIVPAMKQVRIYYNLHKKMLSVQTKVNGQWKVTAHQSAAFLKNVTFRVSESGRQRVLKEKRKNVHAFITGELIDALPKNYERFDSARYNPYELEKFQCRNKNIDKADFAILNGRQLFVNNPQ